MRQSKRRHLARRQRREQRVERRYGGGVRAVAEMREHSSGAAFGLAAVFEAARGGGAKIIFDVAAQAVSALELQEWRDYATSIGLGETRWNSDRTFGYEVVVIPDHNQGEDDLLAKLYIRARLRLRKVRLEEDGASLWFELCGPDGWVRVGRKGQMAIDAVGEPT